MLQATVEAREPSWAHASARLTRRGRDLLVQRVASGWTIKQAAHAAGISPRTGMGWIGRYRREGDAGLLDRSTAVHRQIRAHHPASLVERLCARRQELRAGDVALPGAQGAKLGFLMYPQAENANGRYDALDADNFKYEIVAREITG